MTETSDALHVPGSYAAEQLSPAFPERAAWGTAGTLRAWQEEAITAYLQRNPRDFLAAATPGAGKTTFALRLAAILRGQKQVSQIIVVAPTEHLKTQWADAAARVGIKLNPRYANSDGLSYGRSYHGIVVTYAQVALKPVQHKLLTQQRDTLVIFDEVHHGGDALSWGEAILEAYSSATKRLSLSGTPFRSDDAQIPFVQYAPQPNGTKLSITDYDYGYGRALADGVVRPVVFMIYSGKMQWQTSAGEVMEARLGEGNTKDITQQAWRTALDPAGEWMSSVLQSANKRLSEVRQQIPDAGGLVIATDHAAAKAYAQILERITGVKPALILSDDPRASARIEQFSAGDERWMVAVRMVSEGVDVPRLAVGVYATSSSTPLFFAQAIGRFVRSRRRGELATVFLPNVPQLLLLANEIEKQRNHVLDLAKGAQQLLDVEQALLDAANRQEPAADELTREFSYKALASDANFDRVVFDGAEFGGYAAIDSLEELDFLGLPGLLDAHQVRHVLLTRQARQARRQTASQGSTEHPPSVAQNPEALHRTLKEQRQLLNKLVGIYARLTGEPHGAIHAQLRRICGGPQVSKASVTQLQARIAYLRQRIH